MNIELYRVIQPVTDIEAASRFYTAVLESPGERVSPGRHYYECGQTILACYDPVADGDDVGDGWRHHDHQYLYFATANLENVLERVVQAGGEIISGIEEMPWGERLFYARDPFNNPVSFVDQDTVFLGINIR